MALAIVEAKRRLPYAPADVFALVADVRSYPSFIPWLKRIEILSERCEGDAWIALARARVGWGAVVETFTTQVKAHPDAIDVSLVSGPFKQLVNRWRFAPAPNGADVSFYVAFEFKNPLLQGLALLNRDHVAARIIAAFEGEARRRFRPA